MMHSAIHVKLHESSDEEFIDFSTPQASSTQILHLADSEVSREQSSLQFLKDDERTQRKVQKQLERLQGQPRESSHSGNKTVK